MAGSVAPGDKNMAAGGAAEGGNQTNQIVVILKEPLTNDRKYSFKREPYLTYFALQDGGVSDNPSHRCINHDMRISDYDDKKFLRGSKRVSFLGINTNPINVIIPVTVRLSDATSIDGTISIDFSCNPKNPERVVSMLGTDYRKERTYGSEKQTYLMADGLSTLVRNAIGDCGLNALSEYEKTFDIAKRIRTSVFEELDRDVAVSSRGLDVIRASIRFSEANTEKIMRLRSEGKIKMAEDEIEFEKRMLKIDLARKEYEAIHGEDA
ncbi:hypothetical protein [Methanomethylophilus alvi]|uniref:hypothetical protein n=1 Tax=Methanomethylophilus alvi TaxID=1291540 RepID=UPI0037DD21DE